MQYTMSPLEIIFVIHAVTLSATRMGLTLLNLAPIVIKIILLFQFVVNCVPLGKVLLSKLSPKRVRQRSQNGSMFFVRNGKVFVSSMKNYLTQLKMSPFKRIFVDLMTLCVVYVKEFAGHL